MKIFSIRLFSLLLICSALLFNCSDDDSVDDGPITATEDVVIWSGPTLSFTKENGGDPNEAANQDRLSDLIWITRGNDGGQIYNIKSETDADKDTSPEGTRWALGTTADIDNLEFTEFRTAVVDPKDVVGKELVLLLVEDNIAIDIVFTSWSLQRAGGFAYDRSTP